MDPVRDRNHQRKAAEYQHDDRDGQHIGDHEIHLRRADLLAEELGRAADHQSGHEDREQGQHEHGIQPAAVTTRATMVQVKVIRTTPP